MIEESSIITARTLEAMTQTQKILTEILLGTGGTRLLSQAGSNGFQSIEEMDNFD